jgi:hypothetical protein
VQFLPVLAIIETSFLRRPFAVRRLVKRKKGCRSAPCREKEGSPIGVFSGEKRFAGRSFAGRMKVSPDERPDGFGINFLPSHLISRTNRYQKNAVNMSKK